MTANRHGEFSVSLERTVPLCSTSALRSLRYSHYEIRLMAPALHNYVQRRTARALMQIKIVLRNIYHFVFPFPVKWQTKRQHYFPFERVEEIEVISNEGRLFKYPAVIRELKGDDRCTISAKTDLYYWEHNSS